MKKLILPCSPEKQTGGFLWRIICAVDIFLLATFQRSFVWLSKVRIKVLSRGSSCFFRQPRGSPSRCVWTLLNSQRGDLPRLLFKDLRNRGQFIQQTALFLATQSCQDFGSFQERIWTILYRKHCISAKATLEPPKNENCHRNCVCDVLQRPVICSRSVKLAENLGWRETRLVEQIDSRIAQTC